MVERCLWSQALPPRLAPAVDLPGHTDIAVIGAGYTGLAAARALAGHGVRATVLERHRVGWGASGRNAGFVLPGYQPGTEVLTRRYGAARARTLWETSLEAVKFLERLVAGEGIECGFERRGAVTLAARRRHLRGLERSQRLLRDQLGHETVLLGPAELREEIDSPRYCGGLLDPAGGSLDPARYCAGLAAAASRAGAAIVEDVDVVAVRRSGGRFTLSTSRGSLTADRILVATNGYTGGTFPALRRRVIPIGSYVVATAPLAAPVARRVLPGGRVMSDTWHLLHYFRLATDGRLVFGGRASFTPTGVARSTVILSAAMRTVFPYLTETPIEFAWKGNIGCTLDRMPHAGEMNGVHYALGYCGHGVALSTWLGARMGDALAGRSPLPELTGRRLPAIPLYGGTPWFLPAVGGYYRLRDWLG